MARIPCTSSVAVPYAVDLKCASTTHIAHSAPHPGHRRPFGDLEPRAMPISADVEAKLNMSLEDLASKSAGGSSKQSRKSNTGKAAKEKGDTVFSRLGDSSGGGGGSGGKGGRKGRGTGWRSHVECYEDEQTGDTVVRFHQTDVVRITSNDIILDSGGQATALTRQCMNEALGQYTFRVNVIGDEWYVSDGKFRLIRFTDGVVITGAAKERRATEAQAPALRIVKSGSFGQGFRPY